MRNRLSKMCKTSSWMLALLAVGGMTSSCKDEYTLDDEKPSWLNSSIMESLQEQKCYQNYLRLLSDPDVNPTNARPLTEVLSRTGSKTVFVADDAAWEAFYAENAKRPESDPWHTATSYENLSPSQKKLLIHTSMLNNQIVMENLASSEGNNVVRGEYMRRYTDVETTDSITFVSGDDLPVNYNPDVDAKTEKKIELDYWSRFRTEKGGKGIYLVTDSSQSMMLHFTAEHMSKNNITDEDFRIFMGEPRNSEDVHIYNALLTEKDGVCENGYVNKTSRVLTPLANMAEVLRTNGQTNIFSHMIDRWSVPFYNNGVTEQYKNVMESRGIEWTDSIFSKRYFSDNSWGHRALNSDPDGEKLTASVGVLKFDPGWNGYYGESSGPQTDMGAMYVPNDETMWKYFAQNGGGWQLIKTYYLKEGTDEEIPYEAPKTQDDLYRQIDCIPMGILQSLVNNLMMPSFISSVPSKMTTLMDDAQEQLFYSEDKDHIVGSLLANNGVIYVMDKVYGPADFTSVAAPAFISKTNMIMRWAIYNGNTKVIPGADRMGLNYFAYLKAMQSKFVFLLPSDEALNYYYDPVSFKSNKSRALTFNYKNSSFPVESKIYEYDVKNGTIADKAYTLEKVNEDDITNRLKDILESHTIVLDGQDELDSDVDEYYLSKNGSPIKVVRETDAEGKSRIVKVQGGFQMENEMAGISNPASHGVDYNVVEDEQMMSNGTTYILDSPAIPASKSVWNVMTNNGQLDNEEYGAFYDLCSIDEDIIKACGLVDVVGLNNNANKIKSEMKKFQVFVGDDTTAKTYCPDYNVQFFNNYRYTIFVPTQEAIEAAIANGLPTWDDIKADYESLKQSTLDEDGNVLNEEYVLTATDSLRLQTKITYLINFVRYHFADNSVFVDKSNIAPTEFVTASYDNQKGLFCKINIQRTGGELQVQDVNGGKWTAAAGKVNIMARDITTNKLVRNASSMNGVHIDGSSFAVMHQIPGTLNHVSLVNGKHDVWSTPEECKKYMKRFAIK